MIMIFKKVFTIMLIILLSVGCAGKGGRSLSKAFNRDSSVLSTLGYDRLTVLSLGEREKQILEKYLQGKISDKKSKKYKDSFPREDGTSLLAVINVGKEFNPQKPLGLRCKSIDLRLTLQKTDETLSQAGDVCIDTLLPEDKQLWERRDDLIK